MPVPRFDHDAPMPRVPFREAKKRTPDRTINALVLPFGMALAAGMTTFVGVGLIAIGCKLPVKWPLILAGVVILLVMVIGFIWLFKKELIMTIETISNRDLDGDGVIGEPVRHITAFELPRGKHSIRFGQIEVPPALLIAWCQAAVNQRSLAYGVWEPRFALPDGTKGRERYQAFRDELVAHGFAEEVGGNIGLRVCWQNQDAVNWVRGFAMTNVQDGTPLLEGR